MSNRDQPYRSSDTEEEMRLHRATHHVATYSLCISELAVRRREVQQCRSIAMRVAAVFTLSALSATSAFAPCHSREHMSHTHSPMGSIWGKCLISYNGRGALDLRTTSDDGTQEAVAVAGPRRSRSLGRFFAMLRRRREVPKAPPSSLAGDALLVNNHGRKAYEHEECLLDMARSGAKAEDASEICFNPDSFDKGLDNHGFKSMENEPEIESDTSYNKDIRGGAADFSAENDSGPVPITDSIEPLIVELALPARSELEEDDEELCVPVYDVPVVPSYELPDVPITVNGAKGEVNGDTIDPSGNTGGSESGVEYVKSDEKLEKRALCNRGLVLVDAFSPYHGQYLSTMAREAYGSGVVSVFSAYVTGYLYQEQGMTDHLSMRLPDLDDSGHNGEVEHWADDIPFEIVGVICESDSGLDDAERLGEALGLFPDRADGYNPARRDKFLMNEVCGKQGLRVVRQKMCASVEEALDFARELGIRSTAEAKEIEAGQLHKGVQDLIAEKNCADLRIHEEPNSGCAHSANGNSITHQVNESANTINAHDQYDVLEQLLKEQENKEDDEEGYIPSIVGVLGLASNKPSSTRSYCVVKPPRGVASDGVNLCSTLESVKYAFNSIQGTTMFGTMHGKHQSVLVQEFAAGTEYAVDIVSKAGEHKVAALWRYDKRPANSAPFVYHAAEIIDADTEVGRAVCEYAMEALDALNVHWGMSHNEVIVDDKGSPRLVEVNCRHHNTDFAPLTTACMGYNALDMVLAAYLGDADDFPPNTEHKRLVWDELPDLPVSKTYGAIVHLVSHVEGTLVEVNDEALAEIEGLGSVLAMEVYPHCLKIGKKIKKTVDIRTDPGWCHIMSDDPERLKADYDRIVDLNPSLFVVDTKQPDEVIADVIEEDQKEVTPQFLDGISGGIRDT